MNYIQQDISINIPLNEYSIPQVYVDEEGLNKLLLLHNNKNMLEKSNTILDNPQNNSNIYTSLPSDCASFVDNDICCLCGKSESYHSNNKSHKFFKIMEEYRCTKCNKFFYQHDHSLIPCFSPIKRIQY
jgi:hypothetical protein